MHKEYVREETKEYGHVCHSDATTEMKRMAQYGRTPVNKNLQSRHVRDERQTRLYQSLSFPNVLCDVQLISSQRFCVLHCASPCLRRREVSHCPKAQRPPCRNRHGSSINGHVDEIARVSHKLVTPEWLSSGSWLSFIARSSSIATHGPSTSFEIGRSDAVKRERKLVLLVIQLRKLKIQALPVERIPFLLKMQYKTS